MGASINIPIPLLILSFTMFTGLLTHIYFSMRKTLEDLTKAVNQLNTFMEVSENKIQDHDKRLDKFEERLYKIERRE